MYFVKLLVRNIKARPSCCYYEFANPGVVWVIKITRVYSNWVHVPQRFFNLKDNFIKITFNSNLYDEFTIEGKPLEYILKVTGD